MDASQLKRQHERWPALEAQALALLDHPERAKPAFESSAAKACLVRLWHWPAFDAPRVWTIYPEAIVFPQRRTKPYVLRYAVRELTWDKHSDFQRLADMECTPAPTIIVRDGVISDDRLVLLLEEGGKFTLPVGPLLTKAKFLGTDGEYFGIRVNWLQTDLELSLQWWCNGPPEWRTFTEWVGRLRAFLQSCAETSG